MVVYIFYSFFPLSYTSRDWFPTHFLAMQRSMNSPHNISFEFDNMPSVSGEKWCILWICFCSNCRNAWHIEGDQLQYFWFMDEDELMVDCNFILSSYLSLINAGGQFSLIFWSIFYTHLLHFYVQTPMFHISCYVVIWLSRIWMHAIANWNLTCKCSP